MANPNNPLRYPAFIDPATGQPAQYANGQAANPNGIVFNDNNPNIMKQSAVFGEGSYKFTPNLKLTAGIRFYKFTIDNHADQRGLGTGSANQDPTLLDQQLSGTSVLPRVNLSYEPTPDFTAYGTIATGSRPGGINLPIPLPTAAQLKANPFQYDCGVGPVAVSSQPSFGADSVLSYEIGEKARFDDRRFTLNADMYYIKWKKIQQVLSLSCGYPYNTNAGDASSYGPEVEFSAGIINGLTLDLSGSIAHATIGHPTQAAINAGIAPGTRVINVPKYRATAAIAYQHILTPAINGKLYLSLTATGNSEDQAAYRQVLPGYNNLEARYSLTSGAWSAALFGTNLTNKLAALTIDNTVFAWQTYAITRVSTNQPRTLGLDFQYKF